MRLITFPSAIHVAVWQELYFRWCSLTEMTIRLTFETTADGLDNGTAPVGDKTLSAEVSDKETLLGHCHNAEHQIIR